MIIERNGWSARANALIVFSISLFVQLHAGTLYGFAVYEAVKHEMS